MSDNRFYPLSVYFRQRFGQRIRKIPLDAGNTCPNRDGTLSRRGCSFCNPDGAGTGLAHQGLSIRQQYLDWRERFRQGNAQTLFMAYFQSFSNTYGPAEKLRQLLCELNALPDLAGVAIGTRPDCLDEQKLHILRAAPIEEVWLDLGLQSANDRTLKRINRGHNAACFTTWADKAARIGIKVCAHVITGLPGENLPDFEQTLDFVNQLPVAGIKIHNLYISQGTDLEKTWKRGAFTLLSRHESLAWLVRGISLLRPDIVIHRINADPQGQDLVAPDWVREKSTFLHDVQHLLQAHDIWQGRALGHPCSPWFNIAGGHI